MNGCDIHTGLSVPKEELEFGNPDLGYATDRRPNVYRRPMASLREAYGDSRKDLRTLLDTYSDLIGGVTDTAERREAAKDTLLTWRGIIKNWIRELPATDLVQHRISTCGILWPSRIRDIVKHCRSVISAKQSVPSDLQAHCSQSSLNGYNRHRLHETSVARKRKRLPLCLSYGRLLHRLFVSGSNESPRLSVVKFIKGRFKTFGFAKVVFSDNGSHPEGSLQIFSDPQK